MQHEKTPLFKEKTTTTPYVLKTHPFDAYLGGHGCVASHVARGLGQLPK